MDAVLHHGKIVVEREREQEEDSNNFPLKQHLLQGEIQTHARRGYQDNN